MKKIYELMKLIDNAPKNLMLECFGVGSECGQYQYDKENDSLILFYKDGEKATGILKESNFKIPTNKQIESMFNKYGNCVLWYDFYYDKQRNLLIIYCINHLQLSSVKELYKIMD